MRAITISNFGPPSVLTLTTVPTPIPRPDEALIRICAFGINHAEMHMRRGEWAESVPISGIECVGTIAACPGCKGGEFRIGLPVASVMGGLGRTRPGSYAEYTVVRVENIVPLVDISEREKVKICDSLHRDLDAEPARPCHCAGGVYRRSGIWPILPAPAHSGLAAVGFHEW